MDLNHKEKLFYIKKKKKQKKLGNWIKYQADLS